MNYYLLANDHTHVVAMGDKIMYLIRIKFGQIIITYTGTYITKLKSNRKAAQFAGSKSVDLRLLGERGFFTRGYGNASWLVPGLRDGTMHSLIRAHA